jgi:hypothetical protein
MHSNGQNYFKQAINVFTTGGAQQFMSHLTEIIENHKNLEELFSIVKHYGVSAEFVTDALVQRFEQVESGGENEENTEEETAYCVEILDTLNQYYARL